MSRTGVVLGRLPLRVMQSKTAIVPVSKELMPRSQDEVERCSRTIYVANIDKKVERADVHAFFEQLCGHISRLRLLGDHAHATRIAFVEFESADAAVSALNCSGAVLGSLPIRVSPSKTPVRPSAAGSAGHKHAVARAQQKAAAAVSTAAAAASAVAAQQQQAGRGSGDGGAVTPATPPAAAREPAARDSTGAASSRTHSVDAALGVDAELVVDGSVASVGAPTSSSSGK